MRIIKDRFEPSIYGVGYLGEGEYRPTINGKKTKQYSTWHSMLQRCYDPKYHKKRPSYIGCEVCEEWHNFQVFAARYDENYYEISGEKMNLDKDILTKNNKIYSPLTCVFVPQNINTLFVKKDANRGELPIGVSYNKRNKKYKAYCSINGKNKNLGHYNTSEEAFTAYKTYKEALIVKMAYEYMELIPYELFAAMLAYEIESED